MADHGTSQSGRAKILRFIETPSNTALKRCSRLWLRPMPAKSPTRIHIVVRCAARPHVRARTTAVFSASGIARAKSDRQLVQHLRRSGTTTKERFNRPLLGNGTGIHHVLGLIQPRYEMIMHGHFGVKIPNRAIASITFRPTRPTQCRNRRLQATSAPAPSSSTWSVTSPDQ